MPPTSLLSRLLSRFLVGFAILVAVLFVPAGSLHYWQAWAYLATVFLPMTSGVTGKKLPGYSEYCLQTRFHLIPYVW